MVAVYLKRKHKSVSKQFLENVLWQTAAICGFQGPLKVDVVI